MRLALLLCLLAFSSPASATVDAFPALYDVFGVEPGDVLNIRAEPSPGGEIVGTLAHDAVNIEVVRTNDEFTWAYIINGESMGWVSLSYVVPQPGQWDGLFPQFSRCFGTEPFWSLVQEEGTATFSGIDLPTVTATIQDKNSPMSHRGRHSFRMGDMTAVLSNQYCDDGMSDREFGWEINLIAPGPEQHYYGCCTLQPPAE